MKKIILFSLLVASAMLVKAQPQYFNTNGGTVKNNVPLRTSTTDKKGQWIFGPNHFNANGTGSGSAAFLGNITKVFLKLGDINAATQYTNFTISLSQNVGTATSFPVSPLSGYSFVTGMTQVFTQASGFQFAGAVADSWYEIPLTGSYPYNPALSLVVEIKVSAGGSSGLGNSLTLTAGTTSQRIQGGYSSTVGTAQTGLLNFGINMIPTPLPVSLSSFNGKKLSGSDLLNWSTSSEQNNSHFNLQHSTNGVDFETIQTVNTKAPNGNCVSLIDYSAENTNPSNGHNYYRLEQVDMDGGKTLNSKIIDLQRENNDAFTIYPNPCTDKLNIEMFAESISKTIVKISDVKGNVVKQMSLSSKQGSNLFNLDVSNLSNGFYTLIIEDGKALHYTTTFNKQ